MLSIFKIKMIESNFEQFPSQFHHLFFSSKKTGKFGFETLYRERLKRGRGLLDHYDFILSRKLSFLDNLRDLVVAAEGQIVKEIDEFNRKGISELISFLEEKKGEGKVVLKDSEEGEARTRNKRSRRPKSKKTNFKRSKVYKKFEIGFPVAPTKLRRGEGLSS